MSDPTVSGTALGLLLPLPRVLSALDRNARNELRVAGHKRRSEDGQSWEDDPLIMDTHGGNGSLDFAVMQNGLRPGAFCTFRTQKSGQNIDASLKRGAESAIKVIRIWLKAGPCSKSQSLTDSSQIRPKV